MIPINLSDDAKAVVQALVRDVFHSARLVTLDNGSQFARRTFVRTFFSFLEAYGVAIRSAIMDSHLKDGLDSSWYTVLRDQAPTPEKNGKIDLAEARFHFLNLFAATFRAWALLSAMTEEEITNTIFGVNGWNQFQKAILIRNGLTHPKMGESPEVTDDQLKTCFDAFKWFGEVSLQLFGVRLDDSK